MASSTFSQASPYAALSCGSAVTFCRSAASASASAFSTAGSCRPAMPPEVGLARVLDAEEIVVRAAVVLDAALRVVRRAALRGGGAGRA